MRLWHSALVRHLPQKLLGAQWRECVMVQSMLHSGAQIKHSVVRFVHDEDPQNLQGYYTLVTAAMMERGYRVGEDQCEKLGVTLQQAPNSGDEDAWRGLIDHAALRHFDQQYLVQCMMHMQEKTRNGVISDADFLHMLGAVFSDLPAPIQQYFRLCDPSTHYGG